jgi:hypothetical protein
LHAEEDPALNNPATDGMQKLPEQQVHLQSPDEVAKHVAAESVLALLEVAALHELTPDTVLVLVQVRSPAGRPVSRRVTRATPYRV